MNRNKYEDRVRKRAEEIARLNEPSHFEIVDFCVFQRIDVPESLDAKERAISRYTEIARLSVQREAEAAKDFHYAGWTGRAAYDHPSDGARQGNLEYMLQQKGLIPPQTETT